jgi:hypothetical protein
MAEDIPQGTLVVMAVEQGARLLEMGAAKEALANFRTAVMMNGDLVAELLSDDVAVAKRAAARRPPPPTDLVTYVTSPLRHLCRQLWRQGDRQSAYQYAQLAILLFAKLGPFSAGAAECLDEISDMARQMGDGKYAVESSDQARRIRQYIALSGG